MTLLSREANFSPEIFTDVKCVQDDNLTGMSMLEFQKKMPFTSFEVFARSLMVYEFGIILTTALRGKRIGVRELAIRIPIGPV